MGEFLLIPALILGVALGALFMARSVADARRARADAERRFRALSTSGHAGILIQSSAGVIVHANERATEILGLSPEELLGRTAFDPAWEMIDADGDPVGGEDHPSMISLRTGEPVRDAVRGLYSGDPSRTRWLRIDATPIPQEDADTIREVVITFRDITPQVDTERSLQASRDREALYFDSAGVVILSLDGQGRIESINQRGCELLGGAREDLVGADWFARFVPSDEAPMARHRFGELLAGRVEAAERVESAVLTVAGDRRIVAWRNALVRDDEGRITGVLSSGEDVTELRASRVAVEEALEWRNAVIEGSPDAIFLCDDEARFVLVNEAAARLTGYSKIELCAMRIPDLYDGATSAELRARRERILGGEQPMIEVSLRRRGGTEVEVELNNRRVTVGGTAYVHTVARDLSERRLLTRALTESERQYRLLFQGMREGLALHEVIWDEAGEAVDYRFLDVNQAFEDQTGLSRSEIVGRRVLDVMPGTERGWIARYGDVARTGTPVQFEAYARSLGRHYSVSAFRPRENQFAVMFSDVTARVQTEQEVRDTANRLAMAQEVSRIGFMDMDLSTGAGFWSRHTFELLGMDPEGAEGRLDVFVSALMEESRTSFLEGIEAAKNGAEIPPFIYTVRTESGRMRRIEGRSTLTRTVDDGGFRLVTVLRDVTDEESAQAQKDELTRRLRALAARMVAVREEERAALSRELHDGLGQALTGMRMDLDLLRASLPARRTDLAETITSLIDTSDRSVDTVRDISARLRPPILDVMGLGPALEWQVEEYQKKGGPRFHVDVAGCPEHLPRTHAVALFRIAQEALTNVLRHARARECRVAVKVDRGVLLLDVMDDGVGVGDDVMTSPSALGLTGMQERALSMDGVVVVGRRPGGGTSVQVRLPLQSEATLADGTDGRP